MAGGFPGSAGETADYAISGAVTLVDVKNVTLAKIDDGATIAASGSVDVRALDDLLNVNFAGGVVAGKSIGFGVTVGVNLIDRDTEAFIGNREAVLGRGEFAPNTGVNSALDTIDLGYDHGLATGDLVLYSNGGDGSIGGLVDGDAYYVRRIDSRTLKLARSTQEAAEDPITNFSPGDVNDAEGIESINLGYNHGYQTGDAVLYDNGGGADIGGLTDGQTYYVIRLSDTAVQLAEVLDDALAEIPAPADLDLTLGGSGDAHSLRLDLDPSTASGLKHGLGVGFDPATCVSSADGTINLGYNHGFTTGQAVVYSHGGGASIGGLENKGTYYVIVVDPTTIRLAESRQKAIAGTSIELDATLAKGTRHGIGSHFRATPIVDGQADTIRFDGAHGFEEGQKIVYDSGGGEAIGGLTSGDIYYVNSIDAGTIKLARSVLEAEENELTFFGVGDLDNSAGQGTVINLGYTHGFKTGDAVVYDNGGAASVGGLNDGRTYYVLANDATSVKLAETPGASALVLTPLGGGASHSLRLAIDPSAATGTAHKLFEPCDVAGSVSSGGKTTVKATNDGLLVTVTLAAAFTSDSDKPTAKEDANAEEAKNGGGKYGAAISGSFAVNGVWDDTKAYIADSVLTQSAGLEVKADETTLIVAVSGAAALSTGQHGTFGLAGAVTVNLINNDTLAYVHNSTLDNVGVLTVNSESTGNVIAVAAGLSGAANGTGLAGSVSVNIILGDTRAFLDAGSAVGSATSVSVHAWDTSSIVAVAGALAYGGKAGVGAGVAVNYIGTWSKAYVADSDITTSGLLDVKAENHPGIVAVAAAVGASTGSMAAAVSVSVNVVSADTWAKIERRKTPAGISANGGISLSATDDSAIHAYAGGIAVALGDSFGDQKKPSTSAAVTLGLAIAINHIDNDVYATIDDSKVNSGGIVELKATSTPTIYALTIGGSLSVAVGEQTGLAFGGAGAGSGNTIQNTIEAAMNESTVTAAGGVTLAATDSSQIMADAGGFALALAYGKESAGGALSVGVSIVNNDIQNTTKAYVKDSTVTAGTVALTAESTASIEGWSIAGAGAAGGSSQGGGVAGAGAGAGSYSDVTNAVEASITDGSQVTATGGNVAITARDSHPLFSTADQQFISALDDKQLPAGLRDAFAANNIDLPDDTTVTVRTEGEEWLIRTQGFDRDETLLIRKGLTGLDVLKPTVINTDAGGFALAVGLGKKLGGALSVGASCADNYVANQVRAYIGSSTIPDPSPLLVSAEGDVLLSATSAAVIDALTIGVAVAVGGSSSGLGLAGSGAGAAAYNEIANTVEAFVKGTGTLTTTGGDLQLTAADSSGIIAAAYGWAIAVGASLSGGGGALTVGISIAENEIGNTVGAYIHNTALVAPENKILLPAGGLQLSAVSTANIQARSCAASIALAAGKSGGLALSGGGAVSTNAIHTDTDAYLKGVDLVSAADVLVKADNTSSISAKIDAWSFSVGVGGEAFGGAAAVGAAVARNYIGYDLDDHRMPAQVRAHVENSSIDARGNLTLTAVANETINADVTAAAVAVAGSLKGGAIGASGSGADAKNKIGTQVKAYIDGDQLPGIFADTVTLSADDTSTITCCSLALLLTGGDACRMVRDAEHHRHL